MKFTKMNGLGNDYIYIFGAIENPEEFSIKWSERHFGIGSDGLILIDNSDIADFKMRIFNADGSEAMMCGNGIRCVGKFVYDKGYTDKTDISVETLSGIKYLKLNAEDGRVKTVAVNMGKAVACDKIELDVDGEMVEMTPVSVGNPHTIIFVDDIKEAPVETLGKKVEKHPYFENGVNTEFVQIIDSNTIRMRVWERGSGITMACGTGSCASAMASIASGYCNYDEDISVILDGGVLSIKIDKENNVTMTGTADISYEGEIINA